MADDFDEKDKAKGLSKDEPEGGMAKHLKGSEKEHSAKMGKKKTNVIESHEGPDQSGIQIPQGGKLPACGQEP